MRPRIQLRRPLTFSLPLRQGDILIVDLHPRRCAVHPGPIRGTVWIDGTLFSACIPPGLVEDVPIARDTSRVEGLLQRHRASEMERHGWMNGWMEEGGWMWMEGERVGGGVFTNGDSVWAAWGLDRLTSWQSHLRAAIDHTNLDEFQVASRLAFGSKKPFRLVCFFSCGA